MAQREATILRRELGKVTGRRGPCFPAELKQRVSRWLESQRAAGAMVADLALELGLSTGTVLKWSAGAKRSRALVPVEIVPSVRAECSVSIVSPSGFRVEGLLLVETAELLRALG
jgi:transposase